MFIAHDAVHLPNFQQLAYRMMSMLIPTQSAPELEPRLAENELAAGAALEDWDLLFGAVIERLRLSMDALEATMAEVPGAGPATAATRVGVLECAQALSQLRTTMCDAMHTERP